MQSEGQHCSMINNLSGHMSVHLSLYQNVRLEKGLNVMHERMGRGNGANTSFWSPYASCVVKDLQVYDSVKELRGDENRNQSPTVRIPNGQSFGIIKTYIVLALIVSPRTLSAPKKIYFNIDNKERSSETGSRVHAELLIMSSSDN